MKKMSRGIDHFWNWSLDVRQNVLAFLCWEAVGKRQMSEDPDETYSLCRAF